jgi:flagellar biosynthesis regulator FlaF
LPDVRLGTGSGDSLLISLPGGRSTVHLTGEQAERAVGYVLPAINWAGAERREVQEAVELIEQTRKAPVEFVHDVARRAGIARRLQDMPSAARLALEMASHEESERRAMEGELALLEAAWRQAEEIAKIADNLLVPESVDEFVDRNRSKP